MHYYIINKWYLKEYIKFISSSPDMIDFKIYGNEWPRAWVLPSLEHAPPKMFIPISRTSEFESVYKNSGQFINVLLLE